MVATSIHPCLKKLFLPRLASIFLFLGAALAARAQTSITPLDDLVFGTFATANGGTVTIEADGNRIVEGLIDFGAVAGGGAAIFEVHGPPATAYMLSLPSSITLHRSGGTETMTIDGFVVDPYGSGLLDGAGYEIVSVGATLHVGAAQTPGTYSGSFDITIDYQ